MDAIFGHDNFLNEITWQRFNFHADAKRYGRVSDRLLFYSNRPKKHRFHKQYKPYSQEYINSKFTHTDERGKYRLDNLNPPGGKGPIYEFNGVTRPWRYKEDKLRALDADDRIYKRSRIAQLKRYLHELDGQAGP